LRSSLSTPTRTTHTQVGWLYKTIHKQHHEFLHTVVFAVEYAHPLEDFFCNTLATVGGAVLLSTHVTVFWLYLGLKLWQSIDAHSGFDLPFPWSPWSAIRWMDCGPAHAYHHAETRGNYGGFFTFWDVACGTYRTGGTPDATKRGTANEVPRRGSRVRKSKAA
jgi:sterol desaturase/sphingolipid hydroxylase (fatty acid hydroxylase superfamily)